MTTSGVSTFNQTRDQLILAALRKCGVLSEGAPISADMVQDAADDLNRIIKGFQAQGVKLWAYDELVLFLDTVSQNYAIGPGGARCVLKSGLIDTETTADALIGATTLTLESVAGLAVGMNIGVLCDDNVLR